MDKRMALATATTLAMLASASPAWASFLLLASHHREESIQQAAQQQAQSAEALKDQVSESVTDPAVRREIEQAVQEYTSRADQTIALSLEAFRREAESKERYATALVGSLIAAAAAILALIFRWPFLDRKLKQLEIAERQRALRDRDAPPE